MVTLKIFGIRLKKIFEIQQYFFKSEVFSGCGAGSLQVERRWRWTGFLVVFRPMKVVCKNMWLYSVCKVVKVKHYPNICPEVLRFMAGLWIVHGTFTIDVHPNDSADCKITHQLVVFFVVFFQWSAMKSNLSTLILLFFLVERCLAICRKLFKQQSPAFTTRGWLF